MHLAHHVLIADSGKVVVVVSHYTFLRILLCKRVIAREPRHRIRFDFYIRNKIPVAKTSVNWAMNLSE
jgi:hypothetical protein